MHFFDHDDHSEHASHSPSERAVVAQRSTLVSIGINLLLASTQVVAGVVSRSQGLVADGVHSLSDLLADVVVLLASRQAQKGADEDHPYGHQRYETAASLVLGGLLLAIGLGMVWAALLKLEAPDTIARVHGAALWVAVAAIASKELLFRYLLRAAKSVKSSLLIANAWHARSDAASSLVVCIGLLGNLLGYVRLDPIAALIVGFMVGKMGWGIGWNALSDLMDSAIDDREVQAITATLRSTPGVSGVHDVRTRKMGDMVVVDAHIEVDAQLTVEAGHAIAVAARQAVLQYHRVLDLMTHIDPAHRPDLDHDTNPRAP